MSGYRLAPEAEEDLANIALYTLATWGLEQVHRYERGLTRCMEALAGGSAAGRFTWEATAARTVEAYRFALGG